LLRLCLSDLSDDDAGDVASNVSTLTFGCGMTIPIRGTAALLTAVVMAAIALIWLPAYRLFLVISVGIGVLVAAALYLWHKFRPVRDEDIENKRPLGLR